MNLTQLRDVLHAIARDKGWHDEERTFGDYIALMHSELSEALEEHRNGESYTFVYEDNGKPAGIPIELADVIIRILDFCGRYDIDIEAAMDTKIKFNTTRSFKHGGKVI